MPQQKMKDELEKIMKELREKEERLHEIRREIIQLQEKIKAMQQCPPSISQQ